MGGAAGYVVGADKGDLTSAVRVDKNRLLFVRLFEPTHADANKFPDIVLRLPRVAGGWWLRVLKFTSTRRKLR